MLFSRLSSKEHLSSFLFLFLKKTIISFNEQGLTGLIQMSPPDKNISIHIDIFMTKLNLLSLNQTRKRLTFSIKFTISLCTAIWPLMDLTTNEESPCIIILLICFVYSHHDCFLNSQTLSHQYNIMTFERLSHII